MTTFYILRHGDTVNSKNVFDKLTLKKDTHSLPILPESFSALEKIGKYLKDVPTDANFCSPYLRCRESAQIVEKFSGNKFVTDPRIEELEGHINFSDFQKRITSFLTEIKDKNYSAVSICTHGAVIAAIKHMETDGKFYFFQVFDYPEPGNLIIIKEGKIKQIDFNQN